MVINKTKQLFGEFKLQGNWTIKTQSFEGDYCFNGNIYISREVHLRIDKKIIFQMVQITKLLVEINNGLDYLIVFENSKTKEKLFFIDQLSKAMIESGDFLPEHNYCTLLFSNEY
ncbi:hypothetical protein LZZ90_00560 [Flavobacterium sp. SM15]|uniref:hypothetical protein n=1 Tax=Flavobacterium sp. SM15 TaxID=2908005 RepID=UPI001EDA7AF8|nr:hypothetical protein [Flavobacterium sp. SM15]MCG2609993.1 hypothetical protein [Flavobacterium sp. SM15]